MTKIYTVFILFIFLLNLPTAKADEGMWLPLLIKRLNQADMEKMGLQLSAEEIYSVNHASLKDAIGALNNGNPQLNFCTGELISAQGLMLTNHHCAFEGIQGLSSVQHDYLKEGFWAKSRQEELAIPGLAVSFLVRMEDVTERVKAALKDVSEMERKAALGKIYKELTAEAIKGTHYTAYVKDFFRGNEFYLFVTETFKDVRLVGAPPQAIGDFGGETDNWMWPHHAGDFAMLRIYTGKDGNPADYSPGNVPYVPKHYLPISMSGVKPGDFTMILGYPGRTDRYRTSYALQLDLEQTYPVRTAVPEKRLALMKADMDASDAVRLRYASKFAGVANAYKYFVGQQLGIKRANTLEQKRREEQQFRQWASQSAIYMKVLPALDTAYSELKKYQAFHLYRMEAAMGTELVGMGVDLYTLNEKLKDKDREEKKELIAETTEVLKEKFRDYHAATDRKIAAVLLEMFYRGIPKAQRTEFFALIETKYKGDFGKFAEALYAKSILASEEKTMAFLKNFDIKVLDKDMGYQLAASIHKKWINEIKPGLDAANTIIDTEMRMYLAGLREMKNDTKFYPDANSTLRLSYGKVGGYQPRNGVTYDYYTTLDGMIEKQDPNNPEFTVPAKLAELYRKKEFGGYAQDGQMRITFLTDNDLTGGNSGSPMINGRGELVGIAYTTNWEAMIGDLVYDKSLKRAAAVDIRYVLFLVDKYAGAGYLLEEMKLVNVHGKVISSE